MVIVVGPIHPSSLRVYSRKTKVFWPLGFVNVCVHYFIFYMYVLNGPGHAKMCLMPYANNKGADQPAHPRSLISTFVVRCLDSMICIKILASFCS